MTGKELDALCMQDKLRHVAALIDEAIANDEYDEAVCTTQYDQHMESGRCQGENHIETCPVLIAWQDRKAASEKRRGMR